MKFLSVCSGIEAASVAWHPLGFTTVGFSEIEKFPCSVLSHRFPNVPNFGDMTRFEEWPIEPGSVDILVGGTPCQSFSIAGLRGGLTDERGNLALTYCRILQKFRPRWFVWENVPGVISSKKGEDLKCILDAFEECGYIIDIEILDAQNFGVPQRRRRVFVCGQHAETLLKTKTNSSVLTMAQCVVEILHGVCKDEFNRSGNAPPKSEQAYLSNDGAQRRMKLFGITTSQESNSKNWRKFLEEELLKCANEAKKLVSERGEKNERELTPDDLLMDFETEALSTLTEESWKNDWDEALKAARSFITKTSTSRITQKEIFTCFQVVLRIAALIVHLRKSSPVSFGAGLSVFAALQDFTNYARPADRNLFTNMDRISPLSDLHRKARSLIKFVGHSGDWRRAAEVLFEPGCLCRDSQKGRKKRKDIAGSLASRTSAGGGLGTDFDLDGGLQVSSPITGRPYGDRGAGEDRLIAHSLRGEGFDASEDGTGRGTPLIATSTGQTSHFLNAGGMGRQDYETETMVVAFQSSQSGVRLSDTHATLDANMGSRRHNGVVAFAQNQRNEIRTVQVAGALSAQPGMKQQTYLSKTSGVRRLTPVECERLQGFPDNWTLVPHGPKQKPAADGPRYRAIGNSMAVPVMNWIGQRIRNAN